MNFRDSFFGEVILSAAIHATILMFLLKIAGVVNWSWAWVFAPVWVPLVILTIIMGVVGAYFAVKDYLEEGK